MRAVRLWGLSELSLYINVQMFHVARFNGVIFVFFLIFLYCFDLIKHGPWQLWHAGQGGVELAMFRAPFLAPSSCHGDEQCIPKEGRLVAQTAAELPCWSGLMKSDHVV